MKLIDSFKNFLRDEEGASAVEYAIVLGLVALGITTAATTLGSTISTELGQIGTKIAALIAA